MFKKLLLLSVALFASYSALHAAAPSGSLPVIYINTKDSAPILNKTDYVKATYYIVANGDASAEGFGTEEAQLALQIRGRGNYTWTGFDKKPYRLKLDKKAGLFGEAKSKHWALLAHADDSQGFMRNAAGFKLSQLIGLPWTPSHHPIELVLNGQYQGLYFLTETVRVDSKRVDVYEYDSAIEDATDALTAAQAALENPAPEADMEALQAAVESARQDLEKANNAQPAWLVEIDNYDDDDQVKIKESRHDLPDEYTTLRFTYDSPADFITESHRQWLINEMTEIDAMIYSSDKNNCRWAERIDLTDLAKFYIINQLVYNYEAFHGSCKLFRDNAEHAAVTGGDTKWHFSPVWDFGSAFQRNCAGYIYDNYEHYNHWIGEMMKFPAFVDEVKKQYAIFMDNNFDEIYPYLESYAASIEKAAASDLQRWPQYGNSDISRKLSSVKTMLESGVKFANDKFDYATPPIPDTDGPSTAIFLRGTDTGWNARDDHKFTLKSGNIYTLTLQSLSGEFKLAGPEWNQGNVDFGSSDHLNASNTIGLTYQGQNIKVDGTLTNVTLTFDWANKTLSTITNGDDPIINPNKNFVVYYHDRSANPWETVNVYMWHGNSQTVGKWPGTAMTEITRQFRVPAHIQVATGDRVWKYEHTEPLNLNEEHGIIFNDGSGSQTDDWTVNGNNHIYASDGNGYSEEFTDIPTGDILVVANAGDDNITEYYSLQGIRVANPVAGQIYIMRKGSTVSKLRY